VHPVAFQIGTFTIYWYGVLAALAFLVAFWTASQRAPHDGVPSEAVADLAPWLILGAIVGARALYVMSYWNEQFADKPIWEVFMLRRSGLVYYGGLIGACLATIVYSKYRKLPLWKIADIMTPSIALGHAIGRIGCLMTGCCFGRRASVPWAIHFPPGHSTEGHAVHPTQIYESLLNFALYAGLAALFRRKKFNGQVFAVYLVAYAVLRTFVELFRGDYPVYYLGGLLTPAQLVSAGIFAIGMFLLWKLSSLSPAAPPISDPKRPRP
jgi:phosphatidylglycerol---prolipoprotein diacylglyceryl transferase